MHWTAEGHVLCLIDLYYIPYNPTTTSENWYETLDQKREEFSCHFIFFVSRSEGCAVSCVCVSFRGYVVDYVFCCNYCYLYSHPFKCRSAASFGDLECGFLFPIRLLHELNFSTWGANTRG